MKDRALKKLVASLAVSQVKTDKYIKNTNKQIKILQKEVKKIIKQSNLRLDNIGIRLGDISNNLEQPTEEFFINYISKKLKVVGIQYDELHKNMNKRTKTLQGEFDIVLINGKDIAIIETKSKLHNDDLDDLLNKKLKTFKELFPEYKDYNHHLGLASFYVNDDIKEKALKSGVFILQRQGDIIESFVPKGK